VDFDRPIGLTASKGSFGSRIVVSWVALPKAKMYHLYRFDEETQEYAKLVETADTTFTDITAKSALKKVFYKLMVYNSKTEYSKFSDVAYGYTTGQSYSKAFSFGSEGTGVGQFKYAMHIETDAVGNIYVSDEEVGRVQKFDSTGKFLEIFFSGSGARGIAFLRNGGSIVTRTQSSSYVLVRDAQKKVVKEWGTYGTGINQFQNIEEIAVDDDQNIYIVDGISNLVKKFDQTGKLLVQFSGGIRTEMQHDAASAYGICYFNEKIFVTSGRNSIVRIFDKNGKFLKSWDTGFNNGAIKSYGNSIFISGAGFVLKTDENGEVRELIGQGVFGGPTPGLAIGKNGDLIVSDLYSEKIVVFKQL